MSRWRAKDNSCYDKAIKGWQKKWLSRGKNFPYVLFGFIGLTRKRGKGGIVEKSEVPRVHAMKGGAGFATDVQINRYLKMGFEILDYHFPKADDLPPLSDENMNILSSWEVGLRANSGYFHQAKQACENASKEVDKVKSLEKEKEELLKQVDQFQAQISADDKKGRDVRK